MDESLEKRRELLLKVYGTAIDEYRFNVQLAWDRTKFFLLLSSGFIGAGIGLLKYASGNITESAFLILFFLLSVCVSGFGLEATRIGKAYYREAVFTKTIVERELGLLSPISGLGDPRANLSIAVTRGQRDYEAILSGSFRAEELSGTPISIGSNVFYGQAVFWAMIVIEALGAIAAAVSLSLSFSK